MSAFPRQAITRVTYKFDEGSGILSRSEQSYAGAIAKSNSAGITLQNLSPFKSMVFYFADYDKDTKVLTWNDSWPAGSGLPRGVKIEASFDSGGKTIKVERIVFIPVAG